MKEIMVGLTVVILAVFFLSQPALFIYSLPGIMFVEWLGYRGKYDTLVMVVASVVLWAVMLIGLYWIGALVLYYIGA